VLEAVLSTARKPSAGKPYERRQGGLSAR